MNLLSFILIVSFAVLSSGCKMLPKTPDTEGERHSSLTYVPLDPLPIRRLPGDNCTESSPVPRTDQLSSNELLKTLSDQTVRMAIAQISSSGEITFTSAKIGGKNESYQVILDYMNTDTSPLHFAVRRKVEQTSVYQAGLYNYRRTDYKVGEYIPVREVAPPSVRTSYEIIPLMDIEDTSIKPGYEIISLPVYVGLGLRLTANISINEGKVELTGLPSIASDASAGRVSGSLVVQTLGVTGRAIAT